MGVKDWRMNPNFNKFVRNVSTNKGQVREGAAIIDWKTTKLKTTVIDQDHNEFNYQGDEKYFKADEVEYMINLVRYSSKSFSNIESLKPLFNKSLATLEKIMEEIMLGFFFDRISVKILEISLDNTLKILLRCKSMLFIRS
jgi:hypothetical protein